MRLDHDSAVKPLPPGTSERQRWRWSMDYPDSFGGGFSFGRFLLRDDGMLLCAHGDDDPDWFPMRQYDPAVTLTEVRDDLAASAYDLFEPKPGLVIPWNAGTENPGGT